MECNLDGLPAVSLSVVEEGSESQDFWKAIGGKKYYYSLANGKCFTRDVRHWRIKCKQISLKQF